MSLDGKILARARARLESRRAANEAEHARRRAEAYEKNPRVADIDAALRSTVADAIGFALSRGDDPAAAVMEIGEHNLELQEERRMELLVAGLSEDYLDEIYSCPACRDTGRKGGEICSCLLDLYTEEQQKDLSALLKLGEETFDSFDINLYSPDADPEAGISPRENMEIVYDTCVQYARRFSRHKMNLFLTGGTGLGKTFISTCIAKVVSEEGFSVVYDTASSVFAKYEDLKFGRGDEDELRRGVERFEKCDLMILDDLGTEFPSPFVTSALYTLVNTRLAAGRKTIISSNLSAGELASRYSPAIASRISGEFTVLSFFGDDIRLINR